MKKRYVTLCLLAANGTALNAQAADQSAFQTQAAAKAEFAAPPPASIDATDEPRLKVIVAGIAERWAINRDAVSDTSRLLSATPGFQVAQAGGVSGLPTVNGLGDDRLKIRVDGMELTAACANHMNAPLSNIDPNQVGRIEVFAGVTPVSAGGDSIGGTITVRSAEPLFAEAGTAMRTTGRLVLGGRSNGEAINSSVAASIASDSMSFGYSAAYARGHSYEDGHGQRVLGSLYESVNQAAVLAFRAGERQLTLRAGLQHIPYQGFPNQYMDMTGNDAKFANADYVQKFGWGEFHANTYWQKTEHDMGFFSPERTGMMPMVTDGRNAGYALKLSLPLGAAGKLRLGQEYHSFKLNDFWPAIPGSMMMGPNNYVNVNNGERNRLALFAEADLRHGPQWTSLLGARWESVRMNAGDVQAYSDNMMNAKDADAAMAFNMRDRHQRDGNLDLTALGRFEPDTGFTLELAAARKTRSPNLYERYSWGRGAMAMSMTNWFGDGNGYVGDIDLKPEVAHSLSLTADWHGTGASAWFVKINPYYNRVQDFIDVDVIGTFNPYMSMDATGSLLRFANHDATLYGMNLSWSLPIANESMFGSVQFKGNAAYTRGKRADGGDLYHILPLNVVAALEQTSGRWTSELETRLVAHKGHADVRRVEPATAGYALLNARIGYAMRKNVQLSAGVSNLLNKVYADPLGGVYLSGLNANGGALQALPGYGRSVNLGLTVGF
jgi:iron complex outermembrane receptor protein